MLNYIEEFFFSSIFIIGLTLAILILVHEFLSNAVFEVPKARKNLPPKIRLEYFTTKSLTHGREIVEFKNDEKWKFIIKKDDDKNNACYDFDLTTCLQNHELNPTTNRLECVLKFQTLNFITDSIQTIGFLRIPYIVRPVAGISVGKTIFILGIILEPSGNTTKLFEINKFSNNKEGSKFKERRLRPSSGFGFTHGRCMLELKSESSLTVLWIDIKIYVLHYQLNGSDDYVLNRKIKISNPHSFLKSSIILKDDALYSYHRRSLTMYTLDSSKLSDQPVAKRFAHESFPSVLYEYGNVESSIYRHRIMPNSLLFLASKCCYHILRPYIDLISRDDLLNLGIPRNILPQFFDEISQI